MAKACKVKTAVIAFPWVADDKMLAPLRARFPDIRFVIQPYAGKYLHFLPDYRPGESDPSEDDLREVWRNGDVALSVDVPHGIGDFAPNLGWIQGAGAGADHFLLRNIPAAVVVTNAAGVGADPVADFAIARLLEFYKRLGVLNEQQRNRVWKPTLGLRLDGQTLGIVGLGAIGSAIAVRARAFSMHIIGTRRSYKSGDTHPAVDELKGTADLHDVLSRCDAVIVAAPGSAQNDDMFDAAAFAAMKPGAVFINVGRGSTVDENALIAALKSGHLAAAILDVTKREPLPDNDPLWNTPNIYISAHVANPNDGYNVLLLELFAENLERYMRGDELHNVVDMSSGY
jgi:phosphoglycerate dehydrogenase-like enzyme